MKTAQDLIDEVIQEEERKQLIEKIPRETLQHLSKNGIEVY